MYGSMFSHPELFIVTLLAAIQVGYSTLTVITRCDVGTLETYKEPFMQEEFQTCDLRLNLGESGHLIPPSLEEFYGRSVFISWFLRVKNPKKQLIVICPVHLDMTNGDILFFYEIKRIVDGEMRTPYVVPNRIYSQQGLVPKDRNNLVELMSLPCDIFESGMVWIYYQALALSDSLTKWDVLYFARSATKNRPQPGMRVAVSQWVQQLAIPESVKEFDWEVDEGERIWIQVIQMDLTVNVTDILHTGECSTNPSRVEIYERNCSTNSCMLALLCRNPFNMTPITLVTEGNFAHVKIYCNQPPDIDCATVNYKLYDPETDIGCCSDDNSTATNETIEALDGDQFNNLTFTYNNDTASNGTTKVWTFENINNNQTAITMEENTLEKNPDCATERISIYSGKVRKPENLVTYFCGGATDTYKLTTSKYVTVVFEGPKQPPQRGMSFKMSINAGPQPPRPPPPIILIVDPRADSGESPPIMVLVVAAVIVVTVMVVIPALIKKFKKKVSPPTVIEPMMDYGGAFDMPPMDASLGLPSFPRPPSLVSLGASDLSEVPSIESLFEPEMPFSKMPSPTVSQLPSLEALESPKPKKKKKKRTIVDSELDLEKKPKKKKKVKKKKVKDDEEEEDM